MKSLTKEIKELGKFYNFYTDHVIDRIMGYVFKCRNEKSNANFEIKYGDIEYDEKYKYCHIPVITMVNKQKFSYTGINFSSLKEAKDLMKKINELVEEEMDLMLDVMLRCIKEYSHENYFVIREEEKEGKWGWGVDAKDGFNFSNPDIYPNEEYMIKQMHKIMDIYGKELKQPEKSTRQKTYLMKDCNTGLYKIGRSMNPEKREKTLQSEKPTIKMIKTWDKNIEKELHDKYNTHRVRGEWFELNNIQVKYICTHH